MNVITNTATNGVRGFIEDFTLVRIPPWWQSGWFILLALISLGVLVLAGRRLYLRFHPAPVEPGPLEPAPAEPPHLTALRRLEELRARMDELGPYRLTIECSWVLRRYTEARFKLRIVYQTTREFLGHAETQAALSAEDRQSLGQYLRFCDMVKFARRAADRAEMTRMLDYAVAFVRTSSQAGLPGPASAPPPEKREGALETPPAAP